MKLALTAILIILQFSRIAGGHLIVVGSLVDSVGQEKDDSLECTMTDYNDVTIDLDQLKQQGLAIVENACTLRGALKAAARVAPSGAPVTIAMRSGRILLSARLPMVAGNVRLVGSEAAGGAGRSNLICASSASGGETGALSLCGGGPSGGPGSSGGGWADADEAFTGAQPGQLTSIGTVLDGGGAHQLLRCQPGANLSIDTLRLENGAATAADPGDPRGRAGGAVNCLGNVLMSNVALRGNVAEDGGAIYFEGMLEV